MWLIWAAALTRCTSAVLCTHSGPPDLRFLLLCDSDGIRDQVECRPRVLGRSGSRLLCRGGLGCHRRILAGALVGGPAHALSVNNPQHSWPASTWVSLPRHQDYRLGLWLVVDGGSCLCAFNILYHGPNAVWQQWTAGRGSIRMSGTVALTHQGGNMKTKVPLLHGPVSIQSNGWVLFYYCLRIITISQICWLITVGTAKPATRQCPQLVWSNTINVHSEFRCLPGTFL